MSSIDVSIIVPVYNVERYLDKCLQSLTKKLMTNFEIIVINDGSEDNSIAICKKYEQKFNNLKLISQKNSGLSAARNVGIKHAQGKYISFVDSDDFVDVNMHNKMYRVAKENDIDVVVCGYKTVDLNEQIIFEKEIEQNVTNKILNRREAMQAYLKLIIYQMAWGKLYKKELFELNDIRYPIGTNFEDGITTINILKKSNRVYILNENLYFYRRRVGSITSSLNERNISNRFEQYFVQAKEINKIDNNITTKVEKLEYMKHLIQMLELNYLKYQRKAYESLIIGEKIDYEETVLFFGASKLGEEYINLANKQFKKLILVDNDISKHNKNLLGHKVISPQELKKIYNKDYKLIITSMYFLEIVNQLITMEIISSIDDVMIYQGQTKIEQAFSNGFNKVFEHFGVIYI